MSGTLPLHLFLGFLAVPGQQTPASRASAIPAEPWCIGQVPHLPHHRRHHRQKPQRALFAVSTRHPELDERLVGDVQEAGHVGLVLEHEHQLGKILEAIQVLRGKVIEKPPLKRLQVDLVE